jgi:hypothetical protein
VSVPLLLAADAVELYPAGDLDAHGWRLPGDGDTPSWCGLGNLQLVSGLSDPRAAEGGGHGPHDPRRVEAGNVFLPIAAEPVDGMTLVTRGQVFVLSQVRLLVDPIEGESGGLTCWAAAVTEAPGG